MPIFHKVTLQVLKENKTRTLVTVIGIILSAAMICAVTTFAASIRSYALRTAIYTDGDWHGNAQNVSWQDYLQLQESDKLAYATYAQQLGYARIGSANPFKPYLYVIGSDQDALLKTLPVHITAGTFPEDASQILLPAHLASNGNVHFRIGDRLTLDLGDRMLDDWQMHQQIPCYIYEEGAEVFNGEELRVRQTRTYTVVGFYERFNYYLEEYSAPGYTAITVADAAAPENTQYDLFYRLKDPAEIYAFMAELGLEGIRNSDVLMFLGVSQFSSFDAVLTGLAAVVIVLIMFGSVSLIYNAFSISVSERTRQFGLLSSIGATRQQLRRMVLFEALTVSAAGIPLGILSGIAGIGITLLFIGSKFSAFGYPVDMELCVSVESVLIAAAVALVTVLISAWIPATRATRVSAVEAIRQNRDITVQARRSRTFKLAYRLFGLPGVLAGKYFENSRKKYRATVASLFMSIVLFISASAFTDYLTESVTGGFATKEYDITFSCKEDALINLTPQELLTQVWGADGVTGGAYQQSIGFQARISKEDLTEEYLLGNDSEASVDGLVSAPTEHETGLHVMLCFVSDDGYIQLLQQQGLDPAQYLDPAHPLAIALDGEVSFNYKTERYEQPRMLAAKTPGITAYELRSFEGFTLEATEADTQGNLQYHYIGTEDPEKTLVIPEADAYYTIPLQVGAVIYDTPARFNSYPSLELIYPQSLKSAVLPEISFSEIAYQYMVSSDNHAASEAAITELLIGNALDSKSLTNYAAEWSRKWNIVTIVNVFAYGFIVLISLIAAANIFNTISTNISLRRREFAMLQSMGMERRGFYRMLGYECLFYGSKALLYGLPASVLMTWWIYQEISAGYASRFHLPWSGICIAGCSVFLVVFITMLYAVRKMKQNNPVEDLKNENI